MKKNSINSFERAAVLLLFLFLSIAAASPLVRMDSRDAPASVASTDAQEYIFFALGSARTYSVPAFPPPSAEEAITKRIASKSERGSMSFGRTPTSLGIDGRVEVPGDVESIRVTVRSRGALHLRSVWRFGDDADYEVVVFAANNPNRALVNRSGNSLTGDPRVVWSAVTNGEAQDVLIVRKNSPLSNWSVTLDQVAHFDEPISISLHDTRSITLKGLGDSASCQVDPACLVGGLTSDQIGTLYGATRAVARMLIQRSDGNQYWCSGTLLNSANYPMPLFLTAEHCMKGAVAFDVYWFFSRTSCGYGPVSDSFQTTGGGVPLWRDTLHDSAFLLLAEAPPAMASYAGWDSNAIARVTKMLAVHHPKGDVKKASFGTVVGINSVGVPFPDLGVTFPAGTFYEVDWDVGIVEPGSSGSALYTYDNSYSSFQVQGTLTGGNAYCYAATRRTYYSRFDLIYPHIANALSVPITPSSLQVVEYYHAAFGHYFITASQDEISKLDAGVFVGWARTGQSFKVYPIGASGASNVCRFFSTSFTPKSSHFYTPFATECAKVKTNRDWQFEAEVFGMKLPDSSGACPTATIPLYRLYNSGQTGAPNHRYTTSLAIRSQMIGKGFVPEGYGTLGVIGCVPQ